MSCTWTSPGGALAVDGLQLVHATRRILESVAAESDVSQLMARLRRRPESPPVLARLQRRPDGSFEVVEDRTA